MVDRCRARLQRVQFATGRTDPIHARHEATAVVGATDAGALYELYRARIAAYCRHHLTDANEVEDAVQTTFLLAHRALQRGVTPQNEFAWLHTIAKNVCRQQRRSAQRKAYVTGVDLDAIPSDSSPSEARELVRDVDHALASLPARQRRALVLREWRGLSSDEVARQLGMSRPAAYALLTRARRSLAEALAAKGRSALGLNVWPLFARLKALLGGTAVKAATAITVVGVTAGGVALEGAHGEPPTARSDLAQTSTHARTASPSSGSNSPGRAARAPAPVRPSRGRPTWRTGSGTTSVPEAPGAPPAQEPGAETPSLPEGGEPASSADSPAQGEPATATTELVPELPVPDVEVDLGVVTEAVPEELVPPVEVELPEGTPTETSLPLPLPPSPLPLP